MPEFIHFKEHLSIRKIKTVALTGFVAADIIHTLSTG